MVEKKAAAGFALAFAISISVGVIQYRTIHTLVGTNRWVEHTLASLAQLEGAYAGLQEADSGMRGYVATGKEEFAEQCKNGLSSADEHLRTLRALIADEPGQQPNLDKLIDTAGRKRSIMQPLLTSPEDDFEAASRLVGEGEALMLTHESRVVIEQMKSEESKSLEVRQAASRASARRADREIALGTLLALGFVGTASWITRRYSASRQRVEEVRSHLAAIVESSEDAIIGRDLNGTIVSWNLGAQRIFGYSPEEAIGRPGSMLIPPELKGEVADTPERIKRGQSVHHYETVRMRKNGERIHIAVTVSPITDRRGRVTGSSTISRDITERKRAQEALRASEDRYRDLVEHSHDLICTHDLEGRILSVNEAPTRALGWTQGELVGRDLRDILTPEVRPQFDDYLATIQRDGVAQGLMVVVTKWGERRVWEYRNTLRTEGVANPIVRGLAHDVTERMLAEKALRQSEQRYKDFISHSNEGVWRVELDEPIALELPVEDAIHRLHRHGYFAECNDAEARLLGFARADEVVGKHLAEVFPPTDRERMESFRALAREGQQGETVSNDTVDVTGNRVSMLTTPVPIVENGKVVRIWGITRDVTEIKRAEEAIRQLNASLERRVAERTAELAAANQELQKEISDRTMAEQSLEELQHRTELILNSAGDGILGLDLKGKCTFANPAAQRILGFVWAELIGQDVHCMVLHCLPDGTVCTPEECGLQVALSQGVVHQAENQIFHRKDGEAIPIDEVATPIVEHGEIVGAVLAFRDVSERRIVEKMKNEFLSVVSHELRTPLTAIRGTLGLLARRERAAPESTQARHLLEIAVRNADRLTGLVNQILDAERLKAGQVNLVPQSCTAVELIEQAADLMRPVAETAGVSLKVEAQPIPLCVNRDSILQVLTNLISNAIKFSPPDSTVRLKVERDRDLAVFKVSDEGPGIPADKLESIFGHFQPVDASDTRRKGGTGLGLSICRAILRRHGGKIWAESELGWGSTFICTLPLATAKEATETGFGGLKAAGPKKSPDEGESHDVVENKGTTAKEFGESHDVIDAKRLI